VSFKLSIESKNSLDVLSFLSLALRGLKTSPDIQDASKIVPALQTHIDDAINSLTLAVDAIAIYEEIEKEGGIKSIEN
jgi:hypothetical protein